MKAGVNLIGLWALCSVLEASALSPGKHQLSGDPTHRLLGALGDALSSGDRKKVLGELQGLRPTKTPATAEQASQILQAAAATTPNIVEYGAQLLANGINSGSVGSLFDHARRLGSPENGHDNRNPSPPRPLYPKADRCDAPYSVPESSLRSAIFIPKTFTYGAKPPVILFPGTGNTGYTTFRGNFIPLLSGVEWADPVWVNVPGFLLEDAQVNAEYAAYALNYIASLANRNVSIIAWSQGNIDTQWAFKYWPSTRRTTSDHVAVSADYKGTVLANVINISGITNDASVVQQEAGSDFIATLRSNGGDSGYVPTTSVYSGLFDEIVQPQSGSGASAFLLDARDVGVTNAEIQVVCHARPAGGFYTHEGLLASSLAFALAKDALINEGPGKASRLDLEDVCGAYLAPGLGLREFLITEESAVIGLLTTILHLPKVAVEPHIKEYAASLDSRPQC